MRIAQLLLLGCLIVATGYGAPAPEPNPEPNPEPAADAEPAQKQVTPEQKQALLKDLENELMRSYMLRALAEGVRVEQEAEDKMMESAVEAFENGGLPMASKQLLEVEKMLKRDRRGVQALSGLLSSGGSSGPGHDSANEVGGGAYGEAGGQVAGGSDSGSILSLIGPLLGSSSGGGGDAGSGSGSILGILSPLLGTSSSISGGGGDAGGEGGGGSDSGAILNLVGPLLGSSSGGGGGGDDTSVGGDASASVGGNSNSGSILGLVGPLLGSSSSSGGSSGGDGTANAGGGGGSDSGSILGLVGPLLGSSSGSSSGGSGGDGGGSGGGSGLGAILGVSKSSKGHGTVIDEHGVVHGGGIISSITGAKLALVSDKIQLLLRLKYGLLTKILNKITTIIAKASLPPEGFELKYPEQYPSKLKLLTGGQ